MKKTETAVGITAMKVGAWMFLSWAVILGPVGFVLLCGVAYAMYFSNMALGVVSVLVLSSPLLFAALWVLLMGASIIEERFAARAAEATELSTGA